MFRRIKVLFQGFLSLFISGIEKDNPEALLEYIKNQMNEDKRKYNDGLVMQASHNAGFKRRIKEGEENVARIRARTTANIKARNMEVAGVLALELKEAEQRLQEDRTQLEEGEESYDKLIKSFKVTVREAEKKLDKLKYKIGEKKVIEATAAIHEMSSGLLNSMNSRTDTMVRLEEQINEGIEQAEGRRRVAIDSKDGVDYMMKEAEHKALEQQALAEFAAAANLELPQAVEAEEVFVAPTPAAPAYKPQEKKTQELTA